MNACFQNRPIFIFGPVGPCGQSGIILGVEGQTLKRASGVLGPGSLLEFWRTQATQEVSQSGLKVE